MPAFSAGVPPSVEQLTPFSCQPFTDTLSRLPGVHKLLVLATNDDQANGAIKAS